MSASGLVNWRWVKPLPGPEVAVQATLAPTRRSIAFLVITVALVLVALLPVAVAQTSTGVSGSTPLYSRTRTSGEVGATLKVTVNKLPAAVAAEMFLA